jgi:hypothetical protein
MSYSVEGKCRHPDGDALVSLWGWLLVFWFGVTLPTAGVIAALAFADGHHRRRRRRPRTRGSRRPTGFVDATVTMARSVRRQGQRSVSVVQRWISPSGSGTA